MTSPPTRLTWSDALGKRVRAGDWPEQAVSTVERIEQAIGGRRWEEAAQLVDYFLEEAKVCHLIYETWFDGFVAWLGAQGVSGEERDGELARLRWLTAFPDGEPFEPGPRWRALGARAGTLAAELRTGRLPPDEGVAAVDRLREAWRQLHDRWVDLTSGVLAFVVERFGEDALERCYRAVLEPYIQERYMPYDLREQPYEDTLFRNLYTSFEAMRAHLCGPDRRGDVDLREHADRWELEFDPCGSGGRSTRGDPVEGTGSRVEEPYSFRVTEERHDWAWNEKGVCLYCAHCCFALELLPAERWGHPVRVVDSPLYPHETSGPEPKKCRWTIYKTLDAIPEEAYRRIGKTKPPAPAGVQAGADT